MNRIKLESASRWRAIPIGEWAIEYVGQMLHAHVYDRTA